MACWTCCLCIGAIQFDFIFWMFLETQSDVVQLYYVTEIGDAMVKALQRSSKIDSQPWKTS